MGNIVNDIVDNIEIKPNKTKLYLKWGASIAGSLIVLAFAFGQFKSSFFNRMDSLEEKMDKQTIVIEQLTTDMNSGFENVDAKIDKVYGDGLMIFNDFQEYNNKQLELIVDYGDGNKDMLKRMLEISALKQQQTVETQVETAKKVEQPVVDNPEFSIGVKKVEPEKKSKDYISLIYFIEVENNDTIFNLTGATKEYINKIDRNKYQVGAVIENEQYPNLFDVSYRKK